MKKMKNNFKRIAGMTFAALLAGTLLAACTNGGGGGGGSKLSIGVMLYKDTGDDVEAIKAYTKYLSGPLNMDFTFVTGSLTDNEKNLNAIGDLQVAGCQGIVVSLCGNTFPGFVDKAAAGKTPIASYYGVPEDYYYNDGGSTGGGMTDVQKKNMQEWYVGGVEDGVRSGDQGGVYLAEQYWDNSIVKAGHRNVALMHFNFLYYPKQMVACDTFIQKANEWNASHDTNDQITLQDVKKGEDGKYCTSADFPGKYPGDTSVANETGNMGWSLGFAPIGDDYLNKHEFGEGKTTAIVCFGAAGTFVYPTVAQKNVSVKIFGSGFDNNSEGFTKDFGTRGKAIMQQATYSCVESFVYPLVMLANRIDGKDYADNWEQKAGTNKYLSVDVKDRRVSTHYNCITDNDGMDKLISSSLYATHDANNAILKVDAIKQLMRRYNDNAKFDDLLKVVQGLSTDGK